MKKWGCVILSSLALAGSLKAADASSGCGPGWYVLKDNSLVSSSTRSIINGFLGPTVTLGMTFGTSNCAKHSIVQREVETLHFVAQNYQPLKADVAMGEGPYLQMLSHSLGCHGAYQAVVAQDLQAEFQKIYADDDAQRVVDSIGTVMFANPVLVHGCS